MSEYATFLKVGATSIVLRMLEDPSTVMRDLTLENPIRAIREISHDITCRRPVRLANGREMSALEIQGEYLQRAIRYRDRQGLSPQEDRALDMWEHCLKGLEADPLSLTGSATGWPSTGSSSATGAPRPAPAPPRGGAARPAVPRRRPQPGPLLPAPAPRPARPDL